MEGPLSKRNVGVRVLVPLTTSIKLRLNSPWTPSWAESQANHFLISPVVKGKAAVSGRIGRRKRKTERDFGTVFPGKLLETERPHLGRMDWTHGISSVCCSMPPQSPTSSTSAVGLIIRDWPTYVVILAEGPRSSRGWGHQTEKGLWAGENVGRPSKAAFFNDLSAKPPGTVEKF